MRYVLYVKQTCPFCIKAQKLLEKHSVDFKVVNFSVENQDVLEEIKEAYEWSTVPMIFKIEKEIRLIGGYTDLIKHFDG